MTVGFPEKQQQGQVDLDSEVSEEPPMVLTQASAAPLGPRSGLLQVVAFPDLSQQVVDDAAFVLLGHVPPGWRTGTERVNVSPLPPPSQSPAPFRE